MNKHMTDTMEMLNKWLGHAKNPYLLFGADQSSILCMYLVRKYVSRAVPVLFIDTKHHFEETYLFLKKLKKLWGIDIVERKSPTEQSEQPTKPSKQECCQLRKAHFSKEQYEISILIYWLRECNRTHYDRTRGRSSRRSR